MTTDKAILYSTEEVATKLGLAQVTIRKYCQSGQIKAIKIGRKWLIHKETIKEILKD